MRPMVGVQPLVKHSLRQAGFAQALKVAFEVVWILEIREVYAKLRNSQMGQQFLQFLARGGCLLESPQISVARGQRPMAAR